MAAPKKEPLWKKVKKPNGRPRKFKTQDDLWNEALSYFEWVEKNPLQEEKVFHYQGKITKTKVSKMRAMSIEAFCLHANTNKMTFADYEKGKHGDGFSYVIQAIKEIIRNQKFTGAAADLLNANIISRDLGLIDRSVVDQRNANVDYAIPEGTDPTEAARQYMDIVKNNNSNEVD